MKHMMNKSILCSVAITTGVLLSSCDSGGGSGGGGDGGGGNTPSSPTNSGTFIDSVVSGLSYKAGSQSGITTINGVFTYGSDQSVTFSIGDITIGTTTGKATVTPVDLVQGATNETDPTVTNIAAFLQTIDDDDNPSNGISITENVRALAVGMSVSFNQTPEQFTQDGNVQIVVSTLTSATASGARPLVSADSAQSHLKSTLLGGFAGDYQVSITGSEDTNGGTVQIGCTGQITVVLSSGVTATGLVIDSSGSVSGTASDGTTWQGHIDLATGVGNGTWEDLPDQGTWNVTRTQSTSSSCGG